MVLAKKQTAPASESHKKRTGQHHKRTKAYEQPYAPYAPIALLIGLGFILHFMWPAGAAILGYASDMGAGGLLQATNQQRLAAGQGQLVINEQLSKAAQAKAEDMASRDYWSHVTPDGRQPWWFVTNAGYDYIATGENLAYGFDSSQAAVNGWMNSASHRANILNAGYRDVGFGIANTHNYQGHGPETIVVALYGTPFAAAVAAAATQAEAQPAPTTTAGTPHAATNPSPIAPAAPPTTDPAPSTTTTDPAAAASTNQNSLPIVAESRPVSRLQLVSGASAITALLTSLAAGLLAGIFIMRHAYFWHRALIRGEKFIIKHWRLDLAIVSLVVIGTVLTRTAGFIQ